MFLFCGLVTPSLWWRHNARDSVSNHQPHHCLLNRLFRRRSKKTSKLRATGLCVGNSPGTSEFPAQMASNAENVSIWWRRHDKAARTRAALLQMIVCCLTRLSCMLPIGLLGTKFALQWRHYDVIVTSQITSVSIVCSNVGSGADKRKHQSSASLAFVRGIHWKPVDSPHKGLVTRKMFPCNDVIMTLKRLHFVRGTMC